MKKSEARKEYPELVELVTDYQRTVKGGEDYKGFRKRVESALAEVIKSDFGTVAIVTHGGPIRMIFRELLDSGEIDIGDCAYAVLREKDKKLSLKGSEVSPYGDTLAPGLGKKAKKFVERFLK